jgi:hypothetical protein
MLTFARSVALALTLVLLPAIAGAQTPLQTIADNYRKAAGQNISNNSLCVQAHPRYVTSCKTFQDMSNIDMALAVVYDHWAAAFDKNDKAAVWEARRQEAALVLQFREAAKKTWAPEIVSTPWTARRNGMHSVVLPVYVRELEYAMNVRDNVCTLTVKPEMQESCRQDWTAYAAVVQSVISAGQKLNAASDRSDQGAYLDATIEEAKARQSAIEIEYKVKTEYLAL